MSDADTELLQVRDAVEISVVVAGFALVPFLPIGFGATETLAGWLASVLLALVHLAGFAAKMFRVRNFAGGNIAAPDPLILAVAFVLFAGVHGLLWLEAAGVSFGSYAIVYVTALLLGLIHAAFMSARLPLHRQ